MAKVGTLGKQAIESCKQVYDGMIGKYGSVAAKIGEKMIDSNMTNSQKIKMEKVAQNAIKKGIIKDGKKVFGDEAYLEGKKYMKNRINSANSLQYAFGDSIGGGFRDTVKAFKNGNALKPNERIRSSLEKGFMNETINNNGEIEKMLNVNRVAGGAFSAGVGLRAASGGGLYKDRNGNTNLPGIPFI